MKNYSSLSNVFNIHNNNYKHRKLSSTQNRMMSSLDLNKNKANNKIFDQISNTNFNPSQTHNEFYKNRERTSPIGNNMINYYIPRGGSQYNLNMLKKMNNKYEQENLNVMNENNSIKLPQNNMNNYYNSRIGFPLSNNNNIRLYNRKNDNINTSPNDHMDVYGDNNNSNQEENENEDDIENIANEIDEYNNNGIRYNMIMQNKLLNNHINKLKEENFLMESKANEIIKANEELLNENKLLHQKINQLNNYIRNTKSAKSPSKINNKDQLIQKLEKENTMLKMNYNKILKQQQKNVENNVINKNNKYNIKEINYYKNELNKLKEQLKTSQKILNDKDLIIKEMNQKLFSLNDEVNQYQQKFNEKNNSGQNDPNELNELKNTIEKNNIIINENKLNINKYLNQIKELKEQLEQKNNKLNEIQKNNQLNQQTIDDLKNKLYLNEKNNKNIEKINSELKQELNQKKENEDINTSFVREKISELEEGNDALKKKNEELLLKLNEKNKEIEIYKNKAKEDNNKEQYELLQEKYKNALNDCENYKKINDILLNENNKNKEILSEYDKEKENMNKSLEILKQKNAKYENEIKIFRKTEKNPFNVGGFELDPIKKEEFRYSLGAKEAKTEKYKKMILDYETQNKNDLNQMNMLKEDIKGLKNKLKEKNRMMEEIKNLIETGYKGINGGSKTQKDAIKKLKDILSNNV